MKNAREVNHGPVRHEVFRDQLVTINDLMLFKNELLQEIEKLLKDQNGEPAKRWIKSKEVRRLLNVSPNTLTNMRVNGTLPFTKLGGLVYYDYDDIQKMLTVRKNPAIR